MSWLPAIEASAVADDAVVGVDCGGTRVAVYRLGGAYFATSDACPHMGVPLSMGCVVDGYIECPFHHSLFDIRSGASDGSVTVKSLRTFPTKVEHGTIYVDVAP